MIERIEKAVFFRFTRVFAWLIIASAFIALSGSAIILITGMKGESSPVVTYEDIKASIDGKPKEYKADAIFSPFKSVNQQTESYSGKIKEIVRLFGNDYDEQAIEEIITKWVYDNDVKDRTPFIDGLISVLKKRNDTDHPGNIADTYVMLWNVSKESREAEKDAKKLKEMSALWVLGGSFLTISVFSLLLVLLAIERNTQKSATCSNSSTG